jgi:hypothetical protein
VGDALRRRRSYPRRDFRVPPKEPYIGPWSNGGGPDEQAGRRPGPQGQFGSLFVGADATWLRSRTRRRGLTVFSESRTVAIVKLGLAVIVVATAIFWLVDLLEGPFYSLSTKTSPPELRGVKLIGGIESPVKGVDPATSTVRVASGFLGLASLPLVITPQTTIAVKGKFGGVADLNRRQLVRVAYEILPDRLLATRVDVLDGSSRPPDAGRSDDAKVNAAESSRAPAPAPKAVATPAVSPPRAPARSATTSSRRSASPIKVSQSARATAPAPEPPMPPPASPPRIAAEDTPRPVPITPAPAPVPTTPVTPAAAVASRTPPAAPQAGDGALPTRTAPRRLPEQAP